MIELEIDGKQIVAQPGSMIIQVADNHDIYIPRFCYHKKLSIAANCRMCLVEVEKAPKTLPACATPITPGMKVFTQSEKTIAAQKAVMEFLLINHPLDCPICDQGGECELQDLSLGYGKGTSRYNQGKRSVKDKNLGPLIASEMTRCIQCTRCVRFGVEVAGMPELGTIGRGESLEITTYVEQAIKSELSGNMIDICPVGALTNKPYRFTARPWEMCQHPAIAPHDCLGSNLFIHTRSNTFAPESQVMRVVPRENEQINETWLSDRDRYSYQAINSPERLLQPMVRGIDGLQTVSWSEALTAVKMQLQALIDQAGSESVGVLVSPNATLEEGYLLQKMARALGVHHIDHRIRQTDFRDQEYMGLYPTLGVSISELEQLDMILLIGSYVREEQPLANQRIRKAVIKNNAQVICINPIDYPWNFPIAAKRIVGGNEFVLKLATLLKALGQKKNEQLSPSLALLLQDLVIDEADQAIAEQVCHAKNAVVLLGAYATNHPQSAVVRVLAASIAKIAQCKFGCFTEGANSSGMWLAGVLPHRDAAGQSSAVVGLSGSAMFNAQLRGYLCMNIEPELDAAYSRTAVRALKQAELVVAFSSFRNEILEQYAHIILPIATFAESPGTYVNVEGKWQSMEAASIPLGDACPAWEVFKQLADRFELPGFTYNAYDEIRDELKDKIDFSHPILNASWPLSASEFTQSITMPHWLTGVHTIREWPMYRVDSLVRHAPALQATLSDYFPCVRMNAKLAAQLKLQNGTVVTIQQGDAQLKLPLRIDDQVADQLVVIPAGIEETVGFGEELPLVSLTCS